MYDMLLDIETVVENVVASFLFDKSKSMHEQTHVKLEELCKG